MRAPESAHTIEPFEQVKTAENTWEIIQEFYPGVDWVKEDDISSTIKHPDSNNKSSGEIFWDTGIFFPRTPRFEPLIPDVGYSTVQLIKVLEGEFESDDQSHKANRFVQNYIEEKGWVKKPSIKDRFKKKVDGSKPNGDTSDEDLEELMNQPLVSLVDMLEAKKNEPQELPLMGHFIFRSQITFLFGSPGVGKTFMCFQLANALAGGTKFEPYEAPIAPADSLYLNFELSENQLKRRYVKDGVVKPMNSGVYLLPDNMRFLDWTPDLLATYVRKKLEQNPGIAAVWLDNISFLLEKLGDGDIAIAFMKAIKKVVEDLHVALIVLAHTPKVNMSEPFSMYTMSGSASFVNFGDAQIGMRESGTQAGTVLMIDTKMRDEEKKFPNSHAALFSLTPNHMGYVELEFAGTGAESDHLRARGGRGGGNVRQALGAERSAIAHRMNNRGVVQRTIAEDLGVSERTINRMLNNPLAPPE